METINAKHELEDVSNKFVDAGLSKCKICGDIFVMSLACKYYHRKSRKNMKDVPCPGPTDQIEKSQHPSLEQLFANIVN